MTSGAVRRTTPPMPGGRADRLHVERATDEREWEHFVSRDPSSTFCHLGGWHEVMSDALGLECRSVVARDASGALRGVLPLVRVRGMLGHYLVSMPFVNDGGPLGDAVARARLTEHALHDARSMGVGTLELRSREPLEGGVTTSCRKVAVHLALPANVEQLWNETFRAKLRSQIRRPLKEGMQTRVGHDELDAFYSVFARNMRDLGTPVMARGFFERLVRVFGSRVTFVAVYAACGTPVAASCCTTWRGEMEVTWASSLREYNRFSPNMLLYARMMEEAIRRGARLFNFGRSTPGAATHRFKQQWGGNDVPLPWAFWSCRGAVGTPSAGTPAYRFASAVWRRAPLAVANTLGPLLSRQLP